MVIKKLSEKDVVKYLKKYYGMLGIHSVDTQDLNSVLACAKLKVGIQVFGYSRVPVDAVLKRCHKGKYKITIKK